MDQELYEKLEELEDIYIQISTGGSYYNDKFKDIRRELCETPQIKDRLPEFIIDYRSDGHFWQFIKTKFTTYAERREYIWSNFAPLLEFAENYSTSPAENEVSEKIASLNEVYVSFEWQKALKRKNDDPEGAITSARSLIETTCKYILDQDNIAYSDDIELPKLYKLTAKELNLAPDQHTEAIFKQILGGCQSVVEGLGALRNKLSDSHGKSITTKKPSTRHAELAINLAGTMATFLIDTFQFKKKEKTILSEEFVKGVE